MAQDTGAPNAPTFLPAENITATGFRLLVTVPDDPDVDAPDPPQNIVGTPSGEDRAIVLCDVTQDDVAVVLYRLYRNGVADQTNTVPIFQATGHTPGVPVDYYITAEDAAPNESLPSDTVTVTTEAASVGAPMAAVITSGSNLGSLGATFEFTPGTPGDNPILVHQIRRNGAIVGGIPNTGLTSYKYTDEDGLQPGTAYLFDVITVDTQGIESEPSNPVLITTDALPVPDAMVSTRRTRARIKNPRKTR